MKHHNLKTWPEHFDAIARGLKKCEARKDDRGYKVGDTLTLQRFDPQTQTFTGAELDFRISHLLHGGAFGIKHGFCIMSLSEIEKS